MKTIILTAIALFFASINNAQVLYEDQLGTVYLNDTKEEVVYTNDFAAFNLNLTQQETISFAKEIKKAKTTDESLLFLSQFSNLQLPKSYYLKIIRRAANRSKSTKEFIQFLKKNIPELKDQLEFNDTTAALYHLARKNTFNGQIDALPSVI
ncbi:hypothetical protein [Aquimarina brevivitae]|uniref:DUF4476 domain-containing protein n=1 Tax=Aquimarina brevivitae TaxID=323412 RepID=A0A4Q7NX48_9FLAO|nr:hypothetical protein [Aquimarina brevivitae]RZS91936.1 hypothetical protein EV197_3040 [Aquimarina brevivitae]